MKPQTQNRACSYDEMLNRGILWSLIIGHIEHVDGNIFQDINKFKHIGSTLEYIHKYTRRFHRKFITDGHLINEMKQYKYFFKNFGITIKNVKAHLKRGKILLYHYYTLKFYEPKFAKFVKLIMHLIYIAGSRILVLNTLKRYVNEALNAIEETKNDYQGETEWQQLKDLLEDFQDSLNTPKNVNTESILRFTLFYKNLVGGLCRNVYWLQMAEHPYDYQFTP